MDIAQIGRHGRTAGFAVAIAGLLAAPALAFGAMGFGGFHGGFHGGGFHGSVHGGGGRPPAPPAIDTPPLKPPLVTAPPPMRFAKHDDFHVHDHFPRDDLFGCGGFSRGGFHGGSSRGASGHGGFGHGGFRTGGCGALAWGGWGGDYGSYPTGGAEPVYAAQAAPAPEPPPCPELLTWSPKLGRAIRQNLCDEAPGRLAYAPAPAPRG